MLNPTGNAEMLRHLSLPLINNPLCCRAARLGLQVLALLLLLSQGIVGSRVLAVELEDGQGQIVPGASMRIAQDERANWTLDEAVQALARDGQAWESRGFPTLGYSDAAVWASIETTNRYPSDQVWLLKMDFPTTDRVDFYYRDAAGNWVQKSAGDTLAFDERDVRNHALIFRFPVLAGQNQTLYVRVQSKGSIQLPIYLSSLSDYQLQSQNGYFWMGLYYGLLLIVALYSFIIWLTSRDKSYLYYVLFVLSAALYSFSFQGLAFEFLWPDNPYWANRSIMAIIALASASGLMFVRSFIELKIFQNFLDDLLRFAVYISLVYAALSLVLPYEYLVWLMNGVALLDLVIISYTTWVVAKQGYRPAQFFLAAWSVLLVGLVLELVQRMGVNMPPVVSYHSIQYAMALSVIILSLGLGDRINSLLKEYTLVQSDMIKANQLKIEALQKADDVKEEFIANVSHELRTPLTGIIGLSEIILEKSGTTLDDSARENLNMIRISGQRLANLVNDVIDFSAIKNGHLELHKKPVDLKNICILVNKMCRPLIGDKPIQLAESYPPEPVLVIGDEDRLQQILFNLVSNAIKFTQRGWVAVSIEIVDIDARVMVKDTGIGISKEQQSRIFNRFYQVDAAASREEGGTGLGLAISQKLVELHGTEIILRSNLGDGSTFYFDLPLLTEKERIAASKAGAAKKSTAETDRLPESVQGAAPIVDRRNRGPREEISAELPVLQTGRRRNILVVDDEYLNVRIVKEHLSAQYDIDSALSGHDALMLMQQHKPDLVILDLMMPIMTGFELCQRIREKYSMDELPIVILTAKNRVEDLVKGLSLGANDYISKPFSKEELKVRVGKQFEMLHLLEVRQENQRLNWQLQKYQESERKLRERETRFARMLDVTGDALISIDDSGDVAYINKAAEELLKLHAEDFQNHPLSELVQRLETICTGISDILGFPFKESVISPADEPRYFELQIRQPDAAPGTQERLRACVLPLSLEQEFYLLMFEREPEAGAELDVSKIKDSVPQLIDQINRNVERTQVLSEYLARITPEDLQKHRHLFFDLENVDRIIHSLSGAVASDTDAEQQYREALVKLMQDCHYYWQKVTGESIIELAEKSRIWSVSVDNGRLRTRSMNRYLSIDKLPSNPRWRQVARTAYFVLSKVSQDQEAKAALEKSVARLQDIVESKALN
ncbi:MAG: 7TM diverse intracellular signaling domain-containing protein [Gammaproteobacteria bacterium]